MLTATSPFIGSGLIALGAAPGVYARDLIWVDLRQAPGGLGTEASPFNTANLGFGALPDGGTLVLYGGDASSEPGVTVSSRSHTAWGLGSGVAGAGLPPVLPTLTYSTSVAQRLTYRNVSVALVHAGTTAGLTSVVFDGCPSATVSAGGDATTIYCRGDRSCTFSGSGGAAKFRGINLGAYTANGSNAIEIDGCNITGSQTSSTSITITGDCAFGAISITAPTIYIDPASRERARLAGATFSTAPIDLLGFAPVKAALGAADSIISVNGQRVTGVASPVAGTDAVNLDYIGAALSGLDLYDPVDAVATTNIASLSGLSTTIDGVLFDTDGMRPLLTGQTSGINNGIYVVHSGAWTRAADMPAGGHVVNAFVPVTNGSYWAALCTNAAGSDVVGTDSLTWVTFNAPSAIVARNGLIKTGNNLDVGANADGSIVVNADDIQVGILATDAQHGTRGGGTLHAVATTSVAGFMSAADKTKLDGIPSSAVPTTRTLTAGAGLTGGGDLSADRTFDVVAADGTITVNANSIQVGTIQNANVRSSAGLSVLGRSGSTTGTIADIPGANNQVLRISGSVLGFGAIDLSTAQVTGTLPTANQAAQAHGSLTGLSNDDHTQYIRVDGTRAFTGDQSLGSHALTSVLSIAQNGSPATSGWLRAVSGGSIVSVLDGASNVSLLKYGVSTAHTFTLGDNTAVTELEYRAATSGGVHSFVVANGLEYSMSQTAFDVHQNAIVNAGYIDFFDGTHAVATAGQLRTYHNVDVLHGRTSGGSNARLLGWGVDGTNYLTVGSITTAANVYNTGGQHIFQVSSGSKFVVDANELYIANTGTAPTSNPSGGLYMWVAAAESLRTRSDASVEEHLTHLNGGTIAGNTKQIIRREQNVVTTNGSATVADSITIPDNTVALCEARIVARNATSAEQGGYYIRRVVRRRSAGSATLIGLLVADVWEESSQWDAAFTVSSNDVQVNVLGAASQTIVWWIRWEVTLFTP